MNFCSELLIALPLEVAKSDSPFCGIVKIIIPFKVGVLIKDDIQKLAVGASLEQFFPVEFTCVTQWQDGSIQQLKMVCTIASDVKLSNVINLYRLSKETPTIPNQSAKVDNLSELPLLSIKDFNAVLCLPDSSIGNPQLVDKSDVLTKVLAVSSRNYYYDVGLAHPIELCLELTQAPSSAVGQLKVVIRNPNRAKHENGLWDLGDNNSLFFRSFVVSLPCSGTKQLMVLDAKDKQEYALSQCSLRVVQHASGGDNWLSPNHVNFDNIIPFNQNGFVIDVQDAEQGGMSIIGRRCEPEIFDGLLFYKPVNFWQNFPAGLRCDQNHISFEFFPDVGYLHELQPGEQKTFVVEIGPCPNNKLRVRYPFNYLAETGLLPSTFHCEQEEPLRALVASSSLGPENFFAKREIVDEYGWRNFGDLWADHETENYLGDEPFISHYNNQYDPLYGFLRQYLIDGNTDWFELAEDLAKHIIDIDIYHTSHDRPEYNGGLFWHTDHFCKASTSTHRTYSKHQEQGIYDGHAGGGGPGGQHCYTTGLLLFYWLTGNEQARDAVIGLTNWITNYYEGSNGFFEAILSLGQSRVGLKNFKEDSYSFDRGTANYINALMDCSLITNSQIRLDQAGLVLKKTFSCKDELNSRRLEDVESSWFYTVFLQASIRFIYLKSIMGQFDSSWKCNLDALMKYAEYMANSEYPYLDKPDILEFPNTTWAAQDLRKAAILASASSFVSNAKLAERFESRSKFFSDYVYTKLANDNSLRYTRIQAILMQNSGFSYFLSPEGLNVAKYASENSKAFVLNNLISITNFKFISSRLKDFNFSTEIFWLKHRFPKLDSFLSKIGM